MNKEINLVENKEAREELISHLEVLDKIKSIAFLTKDLVVTTEQVADYFEVGKEAINSVIKRHKEELESNGLKMLKGAELKEFKGCVQDEHALSQMKYTSQLTLFTKRTILNVGMLLTESKIAEKVRDYLLNLEDKATDEQKEEAAQETFEKTAEELGIKLLKKQHREDAKLVKIQGAINKLTLYGLTIAEASYVIQKAIVEKVNIEKAVLEKVTEINELEININRGVIREKIAYVAKHYFDEDYEMVYHLMSDKMRYQIGFNMRAERERLKAKNKKADRGCKEDVPSYLDYIVKYNAYAAADSAIKELMDEREAFKAEAQKTRTETLKKNNKAKKEEKIEPKEAKTDSYTF